MKKKLGIFSGGMLIGMALLMNNPIFPMFFALGIFILLISY